MARASSRVLRVAASSLRGVPLRSLTYFPNYTPNHYVYILYVPNNDQEVWSGGEGLEPVWWVPHEEKEAGRCKELATEKLEGPHFKTRP